MLTKPINTQSTIKFKLMHTKLRLHIIYWLYLLIEQHYRNKIHTSLFFDADSIWAHTNPAQNVGIMAVSFCTFMYLFLYPHKFMFSRLCYSECRFYISKYTTKNVIFFLFWNTKNYILKYIIWNTKLYNVKYICILKYMIHNIFLILYSNIKIYMSISTFQNTMI